MSAPASHEETSRNHFVPRLQPGRIKEARFRDFAVRFVFGGTISVVAALVGSAFTESIGGVHRLPGDTLLLSMAPSVGHHHTHRALSRQSLSAIHDPA